MLPFYAAGTNSILGHLRWPFKREYDEMVLTIIRSHYLVRCQFGSERYDEQCVVFDDQ